MHCNAMLAVSGWLWCCAVQPTESHNGRLAVSHVHDGCHNVQHMCHILMMVLQRVATKPSTPLHTGKC